VIVSPIPASVRRRISFSDGSALQLAVEPAVLDEILDHARMHGQQAWHALARLVPTQIVLIPCCRPSTSRPPSSVIDTSSAGPVVGPDLARGDTASRSGS